MTMYMCVHSFFNNSPLYRQACFDLPECGPLPSFFSQGPMVADEFSTSYHRLGVPGVDTAYSTAENNLSVR